MPQFETEAQCCKEALDVQNASNIGGVSNDFHNLLCALRNIKGWDYKMSDHPAVILFHDKLEDMLRVPISERTTTGRYGEAYNECEHIAKAAGLL